MRCLPLSIRRLLGALASAIALAGASHALTVNEADLPGGAFSGSWASPTAIGPGVTAITGTGAGNQYDTLVFTALPSGAQSLTFNFAAPAGIGYSYAAGGSLLFSTQPFRWGWDGTGFGTVAIGYFQQAQSVSLNLTSGFGGGPLYVALNFTYGANLGYAVSIPSNGTPAPVPLPAGAGLLVAGLAALGLPMRRSPRRR